MAINIYSVLFILGLTLSKLALLMTIPTAYAFIIGSSSFIGLLQSLLIVHLIALFLLRKGNRHPFMLRGRDMFITTPLVWIFAGILGALPFILVQKLSFTNAFFETMAGLTTTGSSILVNLEALAPPLLLWRSLLQWIGGIGFIVMAIAILPFLDVGGMRLFHTESSDWSEKSSPRVKDIAKQILWVYLILTLLCWFGFLLCGMSNFDAINHAMTTLSTGGFSTSSQSIEKFSHSAQWNGAFFMLLGSLPFLSLIQVVSKRSLKTLYCNQQVLGLFKLLIGAGLFLSFWHWRQGIFTLADSVRYTFFNLINVMSTTGYTLGEFDRWTPFSTLFFVVLMIFGGCSGSTAGGIKIFRLQICATLLMGQIKRLLHPQIVFSQMYNGKPVTEEVIRSVIALVAAFLLTVVSVAAILALCQVEVLTALAGAINAVSNMGVEMGGRIGPYGSCADLPNIAKWTLAGGMLFGRLEVMTILVLFTPDFWRR